MPDPFLGEIRIFAFDFAPSGWAMCNGQLIPISQNTALFSLIGITYGGDGQNNFALPNLQGRFPIHVGQGPGQGSYAQGQEGGSETVELQINEMPTHNHQVACLNGDPTSGRPSGKFLGNLSVPSDGNAMLYATTSDTLMASTSITDTGGSEPHENIPPYLALNFCIALQGTTPTTN
jgi:microcystin-dependent protein